MALVGCGSQTPATTDSAPSGPPFAAGDAVAYAIEASDGQVVGRVHSRYGESGTDRTVVTRVAFGAPVNRTVEYATTLASDLSPRAFKRLSSAEGRMTLSFQTNGITRITDLGTEQLVKVQGAALVPPEDLMLLALALDRAQLAPGQSGRLAVFTPERTEDWAIQVYADPERRTIVQLPEGKATLDARGRIAELATSDGRKYKRVDPAGEPPSLLPIPQLSDYVRPAYASWTDKEIVIPVEGGQLAGVLSEPQLRSKWKKNAVPGIVLLSDLPVQNRHGFSGALDYGTWQIFDFLAEQGFAVLRVDDRGAGGSKSSVPPEQVTVEMQAADAVAMIEAMKRQASVDPERIFVVGHGWGAVDALLAAKQAEVAGAVLIGPPLRPVQQVLAERAAALLGRAASPADLEELHRPFAARASGYARVDLRALVKDVAEPVAIFQGFKDFEVSWREDAKPLAEAFAKKQAKLFVYEFVDHLLKQESGSSTPARYADAGRKVDAAVLADLAAWLTEKAQ